MSKFMVPLWLIEKRGEDHKSSFFLHSAFKDQRCHSDKEQKRCENNVLISTISKYLHINLQATELMLISQMHLSSIHYSRHWNNNGSQEVGCFKHTNPQIDLVFIFSQPRAAHHALLTGLMLSTWSSRQSDRTGSICLRWEAYMRPKTVHLNDQTFFMPRWGLGSW